MNVDDEKVLGMLRLLGTVNYKNNDSDN